MIYARYNHTIATKAPVRYDNAKLHKLPHATIITGNYCCCIMPWYVPTRDPAATTKVVGDLYW